MHKRTKEIFYRINLNLFNLVLDILSKFSNFTLLIENFLWFHSETRSRDGKIKAAKDDGDEENCDKLLILDGEDSDLNQINDHLLKDDRKHCDNDDDGGNGDTDNLGDVDENEDEPTASLIDDDDADLFVSNRHSNELHSDYNYPHHHPQQQQQLLGPIMHTYANPFQNCASPTQMNYSASSAACTTTDTTGPIIPADLNSMRPSQVKLF